MGSSRNKRGRASGTNRAWDEWQRYLKKETQRIRQKQTGSVVEVKFTRTAPPKPSDPVPLSADPETHDAYEPRQAPVPGVPREEALQVSDDEIGSTVKPFTVDDYKSIRPLNSPDLFETGEVMDPIDDIGSEEPIVTEIDETSGDTATVETMAETVSVVEQSVQVVTPPKKNREKTESIKDTDRKKGKGRKKKMEGDGELELFGSVSDHQVIARQRLTRRTKIDREELIEKLLDPVISLDEAATLIGVCKTTVRRYTNRNELECLRTPGQQRRFKLSHVLEFVKNREDEQKKQRSPGRKNS